MAQTDTAEELKASTVRLPESLWEQAQHLAIDERMTFNELMTTALREFMDSRKPKLRA